MKFYIKQYSTFPYLEIPVEDISKKYDLTPSDWERAVATFSMYDKKNKIFKIANTSAEIIAKSRTININNESDYFLRYKFTQKNTSSVGEYYGEFKVDFIEKGLNKLTVPNTDKIEISVAKSITRTDYFNEKPILNNIAWYFGKKSVPGGIVQIPSSFEINISSGYKVENQNPKNDIIINFNSTPQDFLWFAIPEQYPIKTRWEVDILNSGNIGGPVTLNGNLFSEPVSVIYEDVVYNMYISNYRTTINAVKILNF
jgi:hypothetical protein